MNYDIEETYQAAPVADIADALSEAATLQRVEFTANYFSKGPNHQDTQFSMACHKRLTQLREELAPASRKAANEAVQDEVLQP